MNSDRIQLAFGGYAITSACIATKSRIAFGLKEIFDFENPDKRFKGRIPDDSELGARIVLYSPEIWFDKDDLVWAGWKRGFIRMIPVFESATQDKKIVACCLDGHMKGVSSEYPKDSAWYDDKISANPIPHPHNAMHTARNIGGDIYFAGTPRKLFKRTGPDRWIDLTAETAHPGLHQEINAAKEKRGNLRGLPLGFHAIDGFSGDDIYAGGRHGDFWHWLDGHWYRMDLPTNVSISAIACGGDGQVYVGCENGLLYLGRDHTEAGERWRKLGREAVATGITSLAWFDGKLWVGAKHGLYLCEGENVALYPFPEKRHSVVGEVQVAACDEALLAYNDHSAVVFDGQSWTTIVRTEIPIEVPSIDEIDPDYS